MNPPETSEEITNKKILGNPESETATTREGQMELTELLNQIEQRANAATPGEWKKEVNHIVARDSNGCAITNDNHSIAKCYGPDLALNAEFIASARTDVPKLVKALRYQQEKIQWLARALDDPKLAEHYEKDTAAILTSPENGEQQS